VTKETKVRLISAFIVAPFVVACFISYQSLIGLVSAIVLLASSELLFATLKKHRKNGILVVYIALLSAFPLLFGIWFLEQPMELLSVLYIIGIVFTLFIVKNKEIVMEFFGVYSISFIYISMNLSFFIPLYKFYGAAVALLTLTLSWAYDSFAYFFGLSFGRHKLSKVYSPNKSYEGLLGGIFGTFVYTLIYFVIINSFFNYSIPLWYSIAFAIITGIMDTAGDIFESAIKRAYGLKNIGRFMPGHGGMLDRIDGLLFVAPVIYIFLKLFS
jgi:phosphatidate cytidylyltransferase